MLGHITLKDNIIIKSSLRGLSGTFAEIHRKPVKIWASRIAFSPD